LSAAINLKTGDGEVYEGLPKDGRKEYSSLTIDDDDFVSLTEGTTDGIKVGLSLTSPTARSCSCRAA